MIKSKIRYFETVSEEEIVRHELHQKLAQGYVLSPEEQGMLEERFDHLRLPAEDKFNKVVGALEQERTKRKDMW